MDQQSRSPDDPLRWLQEQFVLGAHKAAAICRVVQKKKSSSSAGCPRKQWKTVSSTGGNGGTSPGKSTGETRPPRSNPGSAPRQHHPAFGENIINIFEVKPPMSFPVVLPAFYSFSWRISRAISSKMPRIFADSLFTSSPVLPLQPACPPGKAPHSFW